MIDWLVRQFNEIAENIKERVRNPFTVSNSTPFAGTFLIAFILYNWRLVYSLLSFDNHESRLVRLEYIQSYLNSHSIQERIGTPICIAFIVIVSFYILNYVSLGITTFFNRWFKGVVLWVFDRGQLVPRDEFNRSVTKTNQLKAKVQSLSQEYARIDDERQQFESQVRNLTEDNAKLTVEAENCVQKMRVTGPTMNDHKVQGVKIISAP